MMICKSASTFKMIEFYILTILLTVSSVYCNVTSTCAEREISYSYLDIAVDMIRKASVYCNVTSTCTEREISYSYLDIAIESITKARQNIPNGSKCPKIAPKPVDCADILKMGHSMNGIYEVWPMNRQKKGNSLSVYCDMETDGGGWTVIQRRGDFGTPKDYFYKNWEAYKVGFGDKNQDFWLGNDNIFALTNQNLYSVRFDLKDIEQSKRFAVYQEFWIDDEYNNYTLHISLYSGDAGDSMKIHNNQSFSTLDRDNDNRKNENCAEQFKGAWWYNNCYDSNLNGLYHKGKHTKYDGMNWKTFKGDQEALEWTEIKIRPIQFKTSFL